MKNPFSSDVPEEKNLVRNVFDLGRSSVFTTEFGQLYPFFLQEVIPGDSVQLDAQVGLRGMPTLFPLQTKMRCSIEFYYVRNRTLYKDWEDFIFKTKDVEAPWLKLNNERAKQMISTGSLGDALGVPSSYASDASLYSTLSFDSTPHFFVDSGAPYTHARDFDSVLSNMVLLHLPFRVSSSTDLSYNRTSCLTYGFVTGFFSNAPLTSEVLSFPFLSSFSSSVDRPVSCYFVLTDESDIILQFSHGDITFSITSDNRFINHYHIGDNLRAYIEGYFHSNPDKKLRLSICCDLQELSNGSYYLKEKSPFFTWSPTSSFLVPERLRFLSVPSGSVVDATDDNVIDSNPFIGSNPDIKISSLPFRAYEQCMNFYYRNDKNNPYVIDNQVQYNEFIPTHDGGADENVYDFHYRNWELDRFTSAVPSPQFGEAPLVGLTYNPFKGTATLKLEGASVTADDGTITQTDPEITVGVDSDGKLDSIIDFSKDVPSANLRKLQEQMQSNTGISINDLRVTNSFQRFLENTMRRGLRYRNQLKSHHHVSVDYPDIDVPQYIGGASGIVDTGQVTNMSQTGNVGLGDYIGTLAGGVSLKHKIQQYCVEHGWIIGIVSVCPLPSYPQSINKSLIKTNPFDYYLPEFGKIGYVPIHYSELMPLQTGTGESVDDIFGYQKAWYDYMQSFDEVHGDFRISLKDFVLTRTFAERPQLSESFTVIDPEQMNDVFLANNIATPYGSTARWMCRSNVSCIMKRQIPMIGTPSLE